MKKYKLILASSSPRRQKLLNDMGYKYELRLKDVEENYPQDIATKDVAGYLSQLKAEPFKSELKDDELLLTADTVVRINDKIIGKPLDKKDAFIILKSLSNNCHIVTSGVSLTTKTWQKTFSVDTKVFFDKLSDSEIEWYIDKYKPYDKAGAYGIQEWIGYIGIKKIEGSYYNVMGMPCQAIYSVLKLNNIKIQ